MTAVIIDGNAIAREMRAQLKVRAEALRRRGIVPSLSVIVVGEDPSSQLYVRNKAKACDDAGVRAKVQAFAADVGPARLLAHIAELNADSTVHGILLQLPLPPQLDSGEVRNAIASDKDVDGFGVSHLGALMVGRPVFPPCTPLGIMRMLEHAGIGIAGRHAVVVGRSTIVGKPMALMLLNADATVTICNSHTRDLAGYAGLADILVAAVGKPAFITAPMVKPGAAVIDVGISRLPDGRFVGDVDFEAVKHVAGHITPVPGGVGPMTVAALMANTVHAAERFAAHSCSN